MKELVRIIPELILSATFLGIIVSEIAYQGEKRRLVFATTMLGLLGSFIQVLVSFKLEPTRIFEGALTFDLYALYFKLIFIAISSIAIVSVNHSKEIIFEQKTEVYALIVGMTLAMSFAAAASDLLVAFLSVQAIGAISYYLASFSRMNKKSTEAAIKQMSMAGLSAGLFLVAAALLFAHTQTLDIFEMHKVFSVKPLSPHAALLVFVLIFLSFGFFTALFPVNTVLPDLIEGASTPVSSFLSVALRTVGFASAVRIFLVLFTDLNSNATGWSPLSGMNWSTVLSWISGLTMAVGSLLAVRQKSAKRLLSYLLVAESGYLLMGLLVLDKHGLSALLFTLMIQFIAWMGAFYGLSHLVDTHQTDDVESLRVAQNAGIYESFFIVVCIASFSGLPPLSGFIGKFTLVGAAVDQHWYILSTVAIISSAIAILAAARLAIGVMGNYSSVITPTEKADILSRRVFMGVLLAPMLLFTVFADWVMRFAASALHMILW